MIKLHFAILILLCASLLSCQKKENEAATDSALPDTPNEAANYNVNYKSPPVNHINDAIVWTTIALNNRDSAGYWNSFTWEARDWAGYQAPFIETQTLWDSTKGSKVDVTVLSTETFSHTVHNDADTALFAHAIINMKISGAKNLEIDSMTAILRVDNGKWMVGSFSYDDPNRPFKSPAMKHIKN